MNKEQLRLQMLSGVITESEYRIKLAEAEEAQAMAAAEKIEDSVENKINIDNLSDDKKDQLKNALIKLGITSNSSIKDVANKIEDKIEATLSEAEEDPKKKIADALSGIGGGLLASHFVPLLPLIVGHMAGVGFTGGLGITLGISGALIGLAKALGAEEVKESLNEHFVAGGIVGIGAINNPFEGRVKESYEDAFEHFLGKMYESKNDMPEAPSHEETDAAQVYEEDVEEAMVNPNTSDRVSYLAHILDYVWNRGKGNNSIDFKDLAQSIVNDMFDDLEEGKEVEEPSLYEAEINENVGATIDKILKVFEFSQAGNDEMIELANYLLSPEGPKSIAMQIKSSLKGEGGENYFTSNPEELEALLSKLREDKKPGTAKERSEMAKKARAGKDIGEKGKNFEKIAKSASKKYGSEEAGKRVAGAVMYGKLNK
jgi:hypothetical protein